MGRPGEGYPWPWSIYRWLDGEVAAAARITDLRQLAIDLAHFLVALYQIDATGGPPPGPHNFFRGGSLSVYDGETRKRSSPSPAASTPPPPPPSGAPPSGRGGMAPPSGATVTSLPGAC